MFNQYGKKINYYIEFGKLSREYAKVAATICKGIKEKYTICVDLSGNYSLHKGHGIIYAPTVKCGSTFIEGIKDCLKCQPSH